MKQLNSFGLKAKLLALVFFAVTVIGGLSFYSNHLVQKFQNTVEFLGNQRIPLTEKLGYIREASNGVPRFMWLALAQSPASPERKKSLEKVKTYLKTLTESLEEIKKFQLVQEAREQLNEIELVLPSLIEVVKAGTTALDSGSIEGDRIAKSVLMEKMPPSALKITSGVSTLGDIITKKNKTVLEESKKEASSSIQMLIWVCTLTVLLFSVIGFFYASSLAKVLRTVSRMLGESSNHVAVAAEQISAASLSLASTSAEQAAAVEQTSAALEEITSMVESTVRHAESGLQNAEDVMKASQEGNESMKNLAAAMAEVMNSNKKIEALVKVIDEIGEKTRIIDEIVFQTKLLSFNASVEAERAGEHGRGFGVVAQEVGNLAQLSGKAALEISAIVKSSTKEAHNIVSENKVKVEKGNRHVLETAKILEGIQQNTESVVSGSRQILSASKEQSTGIRQISVAMDNINKAVQETAATSEESAGAGEELSVQAKHLDTLVSNLNDIVSGNKNQSSNHEASSANEAIKSNVSYVNFDRNFKNGPLENKYKDNSKEYNVLKKASSSSSGTGFGSGYPNYKNIKTDGDGWDKL
ncbi:MAG: methyl-accepting chemotaxis protein [Pseudobdellovibrionaceae bacterium]